MTTPKRRTAKKDLLTVIEVRNAKPQDKDVILNDGGGLTLRITPAGARIWRFRYTLSGKAYTCTLGAGDLKEVRDRVAAMRALLDQNIEPMAHAQTERDKAERERQEAERQKQEEERARLAKIEAERIERESRRTFGDTVNQWHELALSKRKDKGKETMRIFAKDVMPHLAHKELGSVTKADLLAIFDRVTARGANVLANHIFGDLRQFFNWCDARELVSKHPLRGITKKDVGGAQPERERVLSADELRTLKAKMPDAHFERQTELAIWLMLSTLARVGELTQAKWEHIDFSAGTWTIPAGNAKNAREHVVFLSDFAIRHFEDLRSVNGWQGVWCFPSTRTNEHLCLRSLSKQIKDRQRDTALSNRTMKGLGALKLPGGDWTPHDLRRTGATMMGELGISSDVIERCLNHVESSKLKRTYQRHELKAERVQAWARLSERLDEVLHGTERKVLPFKRVA